MLHNTEQYFSESAGRMQRSAIREILKLLGNPELISFAGGLPSPETFPVEEIKEITSYILDKQGASALQYGTTEGDPDLRKMLLRRYNDQGVFVKPENLAISTGSQQALDLLAKILIDKDDYVLCGLPSYLGGLSAFGVYGARLEGIPFDEKGMRPDLLEKAISGLISSGKKIKFIYLIPDFQNPAGITMPESRRIEILTIAERHNLLIIEDSPYREIRFEGKPQPLIYELDKSGRVILLSTFSKIFAPGFRIAWLLGHPQIIDKFIMSKQSADICSPVIVQKIAAEYIKRGLLEKNLAKTVKLYRERRDLMLKSLEKFMPAGVTWTKPEGGLFLFVTMPEGIDTDLLLPLAIENNVAFVKGSVFNCDGTGKNTMRLNFSFSDEIQIPIGIKRLAEAIKEMMPSVSGT